MLILTRRPGESILIHTSDGTIEVTVCESGHHTRLGIQAPDRISIQRAELGVKHRQQTKERYPA
jgi:carbon storage regulator CsrA